MMQKLSDYFLLDLEDMVFLFLFFVGLFFCSFPFFSYIELSQVLQFLFFFYFLVYFLGSFLDGDSILIDVLQFFLELEQIDPGLDLNQNSIFLEADHLSYIILVNSCFYFDVISWFEGGVVGQSFFPEEIGIDAELHFSEGADFNIMEEGCE